VHVAGSGFSTQRIEPRPEISFGAIRLLIAAERVELGAELLQAGDEIGERLPEGEEEALVSGGLGSRLSGEGREGDEGEDEEKDGGARA
jgi:hypothetical protein